MSKKRLMYLVATIALFITTATVSSLTSEGHWEKTAYSHRDFHYMWVGTTVVPCTVNTYHDGSLSVSVIHAGEVGWNYYAKDGKISSVTKSTPPNPGEGIAILLDNETLHGMVVANAPDYVRGTTCSHALAFLPQEARYPFHGLWGVAG
jgi:hypothetical protein